MVDRRSSLQRDSREIHGYGRTPKGREFSEREIRHYRHGYYAAISFMDAQVGEIVDALHQSGQAENTLIIFTSDHGFHIGEHALWGKTTNFKLDARVPLIIASPNHRASRGKRTRALAELVDMSIEAKLNQLGIVLPPPPAAVAAYQPWVRTGNLVVTSRQLPWKNGVIVCAGKLGCPTK